MKTTTRNRPKRSSELILLAPVIFLSLLSVGCNDDTSNTDISAVNGNPFSAETTQPITNQNLPNVDEIEKNTIALFLNLLKKQMN